MSHPQQEIALLEKRALKIGMAASLFMAAVGVVAGMLARSDALLMDGLFSLSGFVFALLGVKVSQRVTRAPDRARPYGYAADESAFSAFRALSVLGLTAFAASSAISKIYQYANGDPINPVNPKIVLIYTLIMAVTFALLFSSHLYHIKKTQGRSDILKMETRAALMDGLLTLIAGVGVLGFGLLANTALGWIAPIGDALVVLLLCTLCTPPFWRIFKTALGELLAASAPSATHALAARSIRELARSLGGQAWGSAVIKQGRNHFVTFYYDPQKPVTGEDVKQLAGQFQAGLAEKIPGAEVMLVISAAPAASQSAQEAAP